jgi:hypothetical protein
MFLVYGHSRQDDGRNGVWHIAANSTLHFAVGHGSVGQRIEPNDAALIDHYVRLCPAGHLVGQGSLAEPLV